MIWIWLLLSVPMDRQICSLWISQPPTAAVMRQACPWPLPDVDLLVWRGIDRITGEVLCERPASELPGLTCDLYPLDRYNLVILQPGYQEWICTVNTDTSAQPTPDQIRSACPAGIDLKISQGLVIIQAGGTRLPQAPPDPHCQLPPVATGPYLLETPADPSGLVTREPLSLLAGRLLWWGVASPDCNTWSGIDPVTGGATSCGLRSATPQLLEWQNRFNVQIYTAAVTVGIPAGLLKRIILVESQFWPLWKPPHGEKGLIQLTESGADTVLQYSPTLFDYYCPQAIFPDRCIGWGMLGQDERTAIVTVLLNDLGCPYCTPESAARRAGDTMILNAEIIAAYYCHAASVTGTPSWQSALMDFNAGQACLLTDCQAGKDYVAEVMR